jgi:hypothetical protein
MGLRPRSSASAGSSSASVRARSASALTRLETSAQPSTRPSRSGVTPSIRIHPFANGNGRTARIWANGLASRCSLPAFVGIRPRPNDALFAGAARRSMLGDHRQAEAPFAGWLADAIVATQSKP